MHQKKGGGFGKGLGFVARHVKDFGCGVAGALAVADLCNHRIHAPACFCQQPALLFRAEIVPEFGPFSRKLPLLVQGDQAVLLTGNRDRADVGHGEAGLLQTLQENVQSPDPHGRFGFRGARLQPLGDAVTGAIFRQILIVIHRIPVNHLLFGIVDHDQLGALCGAVNTGKQSGHGFSLRSVQGLYRHMARWNGC